jgi:hypothetical protein
MSRVLDLSNEGYISGLYQDDPAYRIVFLRQSVGMDPGSQLVNSEPSRSPFLSQEFGLMSHATTYAGIVDTTFNTPLVALGRLIPPGHATVLLKLEFFNPLGSASGVSRQDHRDRRLQFRRALSVHAVVRRPDRLLTKPNIASIRRPAMYSTTPSTPRTCSGCVSSGISTPA